MSPAELTVFALHSPTLQEPKIHPELPDLSMVPPEYHNLGAVFSKQHVLSLPPHHPHDCRINLLPGASLRLSWLYNLSQPEQEAMKMYIRKSLATSPIHSSSSPVGVRFSLVQKKDGCLLPCIDYQALNDITSKKKYPLPLLNAFGPLHKARIFSKLDLRNAYHLVRIHQGDEWKMPFNILGPL